MFHFIMLADPAVGEVCANQSMTIKIFVFRYMDPDYIDVRALDTFFSLSGLKIDAAVLDKGIGSIKPDSLSIGFQSLRPDSAEFTFTAGSHPGKTTILFEALIPRFWAGEQANENQGKPIYVDDPIRVSVINCGYKIVGWDGEVDGFISTGGLNCSSPYGPWDLYRKGSSSGSWGSARDIIPWSKDGNATNMHEELTAIPSTTYYSSARGITKVTITPNGIGYQINFPATRVVGRAWTIKPKWSNPINIVHPKWVLNIVPAEPGECP
jgi:hypothetical protein